MNKGGSPTDQIEYEYASKFQYDRLTTFWALSGLWGNCYYVVSTSNSALESLENYAKHLTSESDKQLNAQYAAEVRFFRAYAYFQFSRALESSQAYTRNVGKADSVYPGVSTFP